MKTAIVLLNWNGRKLLERFLPGAIAHAGDAEVVVADNASTDDSVAFLQKTFPALRVIRHDTNLGFAEGYNRALKQIDATYWLLLNTDVEVTPGWIEPLVRWMDEHPGCAACQPRIRSFTDRQLFEHAGAAGGYIDRYGYPFCRGRLFNTLEADEGQYGDDAEVFWATGACFMVRADAFRAAGGFDSRFFAHMEEIDLCWRMKRAGHSIHCVAGPEVYHVGGGTLPRKNPRKTFLNFRNNLMMLHKNLPPRGLRRTLAVRLLLDKVAALKFLAEGDWKDALAVVKAYYRFYAALGSHRAVRRDLESRGLPYPVTRMYRGNVAMDYFMRRIKTFGQLRPDFT